MIQTKWYGERSGSHMYIPLHSKTGGNAVRLQRFKEIDIVHENNVDWKHRKIFQKRKKDKYLYTNFIDSI